MRKYTMNSKKTGKPIASAAGKILRDKNASEIQKRLAGCALSQVDGSKQTGSDMEVIAAKVLNSNKYAEVTKSLAGTILSQSNPER